MGIICAAENQRINFIGTCPELMDGGDHCKGALKVFKELCVACDEVIEIYEEDRINLPAPKKLIL